MFSITYLAFLGIFIGILYSLKRQSIHNKHYYQTLDNYEFMRLMPSLVHQTDTFSFPVRPAYMILQKDGQPLFYDLYTNATIGNIHDYTGIKDVKIAEHLVHLTDQPFKSWSLLDLRGQKTVPPSMDSFGQRIYKKKNETWWLQATRNRHMKIR